jgi:GAF domain-containing protein
LAAALADAAAAISQETSLSATLDAIVHETRASMPSFTDVGVSVVHPTGRVETRSGTGPLGWVLDGILYDVGEGPCLDTIRLRSTIVVPHLERERPGQQEEHERRWPHYVPRAARHGVRSQMAVCLQDGGRAVGALNLYSTTSDTIEPQDVTAAELFATHAAIALRHARHEHHLTEALDSRRVIGQAVGIMMERYGIDEDRAFQLLVRTSSTSNIRLRAIAEELVRSVAGAPAR